MHTHSVYFWLDESAGQTGLHEQMADCLTLLGPIETVRELRVGVPAETFRPIVERTYDYAIVVTFDDLEGHNVYQDHPLHHKFVEKHKEMWKKCVVHDITS